MFAEVVFPLPDSRSYSYSVPDKFRGRALLHTRVTVELNGRKRTGFVTAIHEKSSSRDLKPLQRSVDHEPVLHPEHIKLAEQTAAFYFCSVGEALFTMLPGGRRAAVEESVPEVKGIDLPELNEEQQKVYHDILNTADKTVNTHLIHGITGSGKTRVYLELIDRYLEAGERVIFLVPEIALSYQFLHRLKPRYGNRMAILHSGLNRSTRYREYLRAARGEASLVVGTRSAVFAPLHLPALFIIDEEHDNSYKEHSRPAYSARRIAMMRLAQIHETGHLPSALVLGSATPSIETAFFAHEGIINSHHLTRRATGAALPPVKTVEPVPPEAVISLKLKEIMKKHLDAGNQVMLLLNRRGHSNYAYCENCETTEKCNHCSTTLTYHRPDSLKCHICSYERLYTHTCSVCGGRLKLLGSGTQKIEDALEEHFSGLSFARLDRDTAALSGYTGDVLEAMKNRELKILFGTQMVAKGFDLAGVTLVGILQADAGLAMADFRAAERVYQLIVQAAGRSGRHSEGEVVLQTLQPGHYAIACAASYDFKTFFNTELSLRKELNYPPFTRLMRIVFSSHDFERLAKEMQSLTDKLYDSSLSDNLFSEEKASDRPAEILGPAPAPVEKKKDSYRYHLLLKDRDMKKLQLYTRELVSRYFNSYSDLISYEIDPDPVDLF